MLAYILPVEVEVGPGEDGVVSLVAVVVLVAVVDVDDSVGDGTGTGAGDCNDIDVVGWQESTARASPALAEWIAIFLPFAYF